MQIHTVFYCVARAAPALIFNNLGSKPPHPCHHPFTTDTSHFPPLFLSSPPPLLSLFLLPPIFLFLLHKSSVLQYQRSSICTLYSHFETRKTPTPGPRSRGVGLNSGVQGDLHHLRKYFFILQSRSLANVFQAQNFRC